MSGSKPPSDKIIHTLQALGFEIEDDNDEAALLTDGNHTLKIFYAPTSEQVNSIHKELDEVFTDYANQVNELIDADSQNFDKSVSLIASWLKNGS